MDKVYSETFLNISATAATNSDGGLFFPRRPELLLEDEVILNIEGLPGSVSRQPVTESSILQSPKTTAPFSLDFFETYWLASYLLFFLRQLHIMLGRHLGIEPKDDLDTDIKMRSRTNTATSGDLEDTRDTSPSRNSDIGERNIDSDRKFLRRCTILDSKCGIVVAVVQKLTHSRLVSSWTNHIDKAPVNRRGWVLQERLMAPRVLHFCHDQVAWECSEFVSNFQSYERL
jgi:hypothetical protein